MGRKTITITICDACDTDENVTEHVLTLDRKTAKIDACDPCWEKRVDPVTELMALGRTRKKPGRKPQK
jgi:hypothetical protein